MSSNSDSEDDIPLSHLIRNRQQKAAATVKSTQVRNAKSIGKNVDKQAKSTVKKTNTRKDTNNACKQQELTEELYQSLKGKLVQELLCRWWYAIEWPPDTKLETPHKAQELDGFRGTFIRVKGESMGSIVDTRISTGKPSFLHFFAMNSKEVQTLLIRAYQNQMQALEKHEGSNTALYKELQQCLKAITHFDTHKSDKSVVKILQQYPEFAKQIQQSVVKTET